MRPKNLCLILSVSCYVFSYFLRMINIKAFFFCISWSTTHGGYKWIIMLEKCGYQDLHVFHLKWWAPMTIEKIKTLGAVLELPARQNCQSSPFTSKNGKNGLNWLWCLDGSPQDFDFSNYHGFSTFLLGNWNPLLECIYNFHYGNGVPTMFT